MLEPYMNLTPEELEGFTLFKSTKGWQLSIRKSSEPGWLINHIKPEFAMTILRMLEDVEIEPHKVDAVPYVTLNITAAVEPPTKPQIKLRTRSLSKEETTSSKSPFQL